MPKFAANLTMMFNEVPFPERFARAAKAGFQGVEFLFPYDHAPQEVAGWLQENRLVKALFNMPPGDWSTGERGLASLPGREPPIVCEPAPLNCGALTAIKGGGPYTNERAGSLWCNRLCFDKEHTGKL